MNTNEVDAVVHVIRASDLLRKAQNATRGTVDGDWVEFHNLVILARERASQALDIAEHIAKAGAA